MLSKTKSRRNSQTLGGKKKYKKVKKIESSEEWREFLEIIESIDNSCSKVDNHDEVPEK